MINKFEKNKKYAEEFLKLLDPSIPKPSINWNDSGQVVLEWYSNGKEAIVSFEDGDGYYGYAYTENGAEFIPGDIEGVHIKDGSIPLDLYIHLKEYV